MAAILTVSTTHMVQNPSLNHAGGVKSDHFIAGNHGITLDLTATTLTVTGPLGVTKVPVQRVVEWTE